MTFNSVYELENNTQLNRVIFSRLELLMNTDNTTDRAFDDRILYVIFSTPELMKIYEGSLISDPNIVYTSDFHQVFSKKSNTRRVISYILVNPKPSRITQFLEFGFDFISVNMLSKPDPKLIKTEDPKIFYIKVSDLDILKYSKYKLTYNKVNSELESIYGKLAEVRKI